MHLRLLRTLHWEQLFNRYVSLDLVSKTAMWSTSDVRYVAKVVQTTLA
jgi:hypothetical protein